MVRKDNIDNPFASPTTADDMPMDKANQSRARNTWTRFSVDAISVLLAAWAALLFRYDFSIAELGNRYVVPSLLLASASLLGIWMLGGYSAANLNKSWRAASGVVVFGILLGAVSSNRQFQNFVSIPRSALILEVVLGVVLLTATRRLIKLRRSH